MIKSNILRRIWATSRHLLDGRAQSPRPVAGTPEGISFEALDDLCLRLWKESLQEVSYLHLSDWKLTGPFRLFLRTRKGRRWLLIYKDAEYNDHHFPGLIGHPAQLGSAEFCVYSRAQGSLAQYLPTVYRADELTPGRHYRYLLEDLSDEYDPVSSSDEVLRAAEALPALHRALEEWVNVVGRAHLLQYDSDFRASFLAYVQKNLQEFTQKSEEETLVELCRRWSPISQVYTSSEFHDLEPPRPIHGDFCQSNILLHRKSPNRIKLVDWEWTGIGKAHVDLATLVKRLTPEVEERALR